MPSSLALRLRDALVGLQPGHPDRVEALRGLYADDTVFRDPIQEIHGLDAFIEMNHRLLGRARSLDWEIRAMQGDEDEVFLEWTMRGKARLGPALSLEGATRATARGGKIVHHRDYWDFGELLASGLPGGMRLLHLLRGPLG